MKTKNFFLMAAMLLMSVCTFAQNNNTPLKGDVNGDGKVDMADVTALIDIILGRSGTEPVNPPEEPTYYWYVGTTKPTSLDYEGVTSISEYPAEQTYTNNSGAKAHIFVLTNSDKNVTFISPSENSPISQLEVDTTTIPGYKIFETGVGTANTKSIIIRIS